MSRRRDRLVLGMCERRCKTCDVRVLHFVWILHYASFFFFNDPATTEIYTLSLHDALPICVVNNDLPSAVGLTSGDMILVDDVGTGVRLPSVGAIGRAHV